MAVLIAVADGSEDMETIICADILRRAGIEVTLASIESAPLVTLSRKARLECDAMLTDCLTAQWELIVLPGGLPGAERLRDCAPLQALLAARLESALPVAAICAAPALALGDTGKLDGRTATCHPGFRPPARDTGTAIHWRDDRVVVDGNLITSQGPGTAMEFALALVAFLRGEEKRQQVAAPMVL